MSFTTESRADELLNETIPDLEDQLGDDPNPELFEDLKDSYEELLEISEDLADRKPYQWAGVPDECKSRLLDLEQLESGSQPSRGSDSVSRGDDLGVSTDDCAVDDPTHNDNKPQEQSEKEEPTDSSSDDVYEIINPEPTFNDVVGLEGVKQNLREKVEAPLKDAEKLDRLGIEPANGTVLYGPPGNGKTFICEATANELDAAVMKVKGSDIKSKYVSEPEQNIDRLFTAAREHAPCVVVLDEIDVLLSARGNDNNSTGHDSMVGEFLAQMSEIRPGDNVFVVGTTNKKEDLDPAATRPGRLEDETYVPFPEGTDRRNMLHNELTSAEHIITDDVIEWVANETAWYTFADLMAIVNNAGWIAYRDERDCITDEDLINAYKDYAPSIEKEEWINDERGHRENGGQ